MLEKVIFILIAFVSNIVQAASGFGGTVIAMPFSIRLIGLTESRAVLNAVGFLVSLIVAVFNLKKIVWKEVLKIVIFMSIGLVSGYFISMINLPDIIFRIYGVIIVIIAVFLFFNKDSINIPKFISYIILIFAGIFHYLYISGGPFLVIYAELNLKEKEEFRATLSFSWVILDGVILVENTINKVWNSEILILLLIVFVTSILAIFIGRFIERHSNQKLFNRITCVLLIIAGISCIF